MDVSCVHSGKRMGGDSGMPLGLDLKQIFFTNLQLLGFDAAAMEIKYKIPFNKDMFNLPNKAGAEAVLYFLFHRLNPTMCRQEFRDCWPVTDKKSESIFRKICCIWLQNIQKEEADARLPRINASLFLSPGGDKFCHLLLAFSTYVVLYVIRKEHGIKDSGALGYPTLTSQNKELATIMETTVNCAAVRHRRRYLQTVRQTLAAKEHWQDYADEVTKQMRSLTKSIRELEREKRDQVQQAAQKGIARGSPVPPSRTSYNFDMSEHTAKRAQRVQQVRALWKGTEGYMEKSKENQEIVTSIVDRTQEKYSIDVANIKISIPNLMLRECEEEICRVDNIYEGGELNLVSVLQLWNLALRMYIQRLNQDGIKDLSEEANSMRMQAHTHQAYLANTSALREKMAKEVPQRKRVVTQLRRQFHSEVTPSGLSMSAPSPPVNFDLPRGHTGATPTGPVLQMTPDLVETPEAASAIAKSISQSSRRNMVEPFQTKAFGITGSQNRNQNNSNRLPQPTRTGSGPSRIKTSKQPSSSKGRGEIQPRVVRHISRQPASSSTAGHKKPQYLATKKTPVSSGQPQASSPEKVPSSRSIDPDKTPVPSDYNANAVETPRHRAHNILADKIVWSVMHGEEEDEDALDLQFPQTLSATSSAMRTSSSPIALPFSAVTPSQRHGISVQHTSLILDEDSSLYSQTLKDTQHRNQTQDSQKLSFPLKQNEMLSDNEQNQTMFSVTKSPVTLVQQAWMTSPEHQSAAPGVSVDYVSDAGRASRTEGDGGELEAEDVNVQNPVAALSEEAFVTHDLIHRSPLAVDIRRMWQDAISDDADNQQSSSTRESVTGWQNRSNVSSDGTLTPPVQGSSARVNPFISDYLSKTESPHLLLLRGNPAADEKHSDHDSLLSSFNGEHAGKLSKRKEKEEEKAQRTMINETLAFITSFDEGTERDDDSTVEWEERLSALYDDHADLEKDAEKENATWDTDGAAYNSAVDDLFRSKTPALTHSRVAGRTDFLDKAQITPARSPDSPLITFTPQIPTPLTTGQGASAKLFAPTSKTPQPVASESMMDNHMLDTHPQKTDRQGSVSKSTKGKEMDFSGDTSDKENTHFSSHNVKDNHTQSSDRVRTTFLSDSPKLVASKEATTSPNKSAHSFSSSFPGHQDELHGEDDLDMFGASPLNESFTPLQSGLCVQGKSQSKSVSEHPSASMLPGAASVRPASFSGLAVRDNLDENLAAQLSRLRKIKAEAFKHLEVERTNSGGEIAREADDGPSKGASSLHTVMQRPTTVGEEQPLEDVGSEPWDIFGEDDSVLLPASP